MLLSLRFGFQTAASFSQGEASFLLFSSRSINFSDTDRWILITKIWLSLNFVIVSLKFCYYLVSDPGFPKSPALQFTSNCILRRCFEVSWIPVESADPHGGLPQLRPGRGANVSMGCTRRAGVGQCRGASALSPPCASRTATCRGATQAHMLWC